jgi:hypothetical protein
MTSTQAWERKREGEKGKREREVSEWERERQRQRQTERQRETDRERETERQRERLLTLSHRSHVDSRCPSLALSLPRHRGEEDVEQVEDLTEGGVLPGEHLALDHVDEEIEQDDDAEGVLPRGRIQQLLHTHLRGDSASELCAEIVCL